MGSSFKPVANDYIYRTFKEPEEQLGQHRAPISLPSADSKSPSIAGRRERLIFAFPVAGMRQENWILQRKKCLPMKNHCLSGRLFLFFCWNAN